MALFNLLLQIGYGVRPFSVELRVWSMFPSVVRVDGVNGGTHLKGLLLESLDSDLHGQVPEYTERNEPAKTKGEMDDGKELRDECRASRTPISGLSVSAELPRGCRRMGPHNACSLRQLRSGQLLSSTTPSPTTTWTTNQATNMCAA